MVSSLDYRFDKGNAAARATAREKFLRDVLDRARKVRAALRKHGVEALLLDLMLLQKPFQQFMRSERGWPLLDADMNPKAVGPIGDVLRAFDGLQSVSIDAFDDALTICEQKVAKALGEGRRAATRDTEHVSA